MPSYQPSTVLVRYERDELLRMGKYSEECASWENAAILAHYGKGKLLLTSLHPEIDRDNISPKDFAEISTQTDWKKVKSLLSPYDGAVQFALDNLIEPLEREALP